MLAAVAFMALFELVKDLLFPSIPLWRSHLITIIVSGAVATVASLFVYYKFARSPNPTANLSSNLQMPCWFIAKQNPLCEQGLRLTLRGFIRW